MSDPRYRPRDFCVRPERFGQVGDVDWKPAATPDAIRHRAAQMQHEWSKKIRRRMGEEGVSMKSFARRSGMSYDRVAKILRGDTIMRLEDIAAAQLILGRVDEGVLPQPGAPSEHQGYLSPSRPATSRNS